MRSISRTITLRTPRPAQDVARARDGIHAAFAFAIISMKR
jgi:hypothetical protein